MPLIFRALMESAPTAGILRYYEGKPVNVSGLYSDVARPCAWMCGCDRWVSSTECARCGENVDPETWALVPTLERLGVLEYWW